MLEEVDSMLTSNKFWSFSILLYPILDIPFNSPYFVFISYSGSFDTQKYILKGQKIQSLNGNFKFRNYYIVQDASNSTANIL